MFKTAKQKIEERVCKIEKELTLLKQQLKDENSKIYRPRSKTRSYYATNADGTVFYSSSNAETRYDAGNHFLDNDSAEYYTARRNARNRFELLAEVANGRIVRPEEIVCKDRITVTWDRALDMFVFTKDNRCGYSGMPVFMNTEAAMQCLNSTTIDDLYFIFGREVNRGPVKLG